MPDAKPDKRRRHDPELKRQVLAECAAPGASVAKVAMSHGLNANLVHKWRRSERTGGDTALAGAFVPVTVVSAPPAVEPPQFIEVDMQRDPVNVRVRWPMASASSCTTWLREMLR
jgi:transposase